MAIRINSLLFIFALMFIASTLVTVEVDGLDNLVCVIMGACPGLSSQCHSYCLNQRHFPKGGQCKPDTGFCCCNG
ncbi:unnamed protein product [Lathyrus oleraceus]